MSTKIVSTLKPIDFIVEQVLNFYTISLQTEIVFRNFLQKKLGIYSNYPEIPDT